MKMNNLTRNSLFISFAVLALLFISCGDSGPKRNTATSGHVRIAADETLRPIVSEWVNAFQNLYTETKVDIDYFPEKELFNRLIHDSINFVIATRDVTQEELPILLKKEDRPRVSKLAYEAIAAITNLSSKDSLMTFESISDLLTGKSTRWNQLCTDSKNQNEIQIIFDNNGSSILRYFIDTLKLKSKINPNISSAASCKEVIQAVSKSKNALGFVNLAWVSNGDAAESQSFLNSIQVAKISPPAYIKGGNYFYRPYIAHLAEQIYPPHVYDNSTGTYKMVGDSTYTYPYIRTIYAVNAEGRVGLATGFASFIAGEKGQRIALQAGLLPATMPVRPVNFTK